VEARQRFRSVESLRLDQDITRDAFVDRGAPIKSGSKLPKLTQNGGKTPGSGRTQQLTVAQIKDALAQTINNVTRTAAMLGVSRQTIHVLYQ
jgi:transcriptional regulator with PAS, ATPase and Fis domain